MQSLAIWMACLCFGLTCFSGCPSTATVDPEAKSRSAVKNGSTEDWYLVEQEEYAKGDAAKDPLRDRLEKIDTPAMGSTATSDFWANVFGVLFQIFRLLALIGIIMSIVAILFVVGKTMGVIPPRRKEHRKLESFEAKILDLPFRVEAPVDGLREEAERLRSRGDYSKAIIYLFSHILISLDAARRVRLQRGKTNGMYLRELRKWPDVRGYVRTVVVAFERVFFGRHVLSEEEFTECWNGLVEFEKRIAVPLEEKSAVVPMALEVTA